MEDHDGPIIQRSYRLAESDRFDGRHLQAYESFPPSERYGLTDQLRRAAVSVASNVRRDTAARLGASTSSSLGYARGSNCEVETQLVIAATLLGRRFKSRNRGEAVRGCESPASRPDQSLGSSPSGLVPSSRFVQPIGPICLPRFAKYCSHNSSPSPFVPLSFDPASLMTLDLGGFYQ